MEAEKESRKTLIYDVRNHRAFIRKAEAKFMAHKEANAVMGGKDPIMKFLRRQTAIKTELTGDAAVTLPTKATIKGAPVETCKKFIEVLETRLDGKANNNTVLTPALIDTLEEEIKAWNVGEGYIYKVLIDAIDKKPGLVCQVQGAGRTQLDKIKESYKNQAKKTSGTLIYCWNNIKMQSKEMVADYHSRFDNLVKEMKEAKPEPLLRTKGEKRLNFIAGLERGGRFLGELKDFRKNDETIENMIAWLTSIEHAAAEDLLNEHGLTMPGYSTKVDIGVLSKEELMASKICMHYYNHGSCRFGNKCHYKHIDNPEAKPKTRGKRKTKKKTPLFRN